MKGQPSDFWGKLSTGDDGSVVAWHPLIDHCADVAACAEALLETGCLSRRLARLAGLRRFTIEQRARLAVIAGFHDVGKFISGFQNKAFPPATPITGHVREVLAVFGDFPSREQELLLDRLPSQELESWAPEQSAFRLLIASICHHGRPYKAGGNHQSAWWTRRRGLDPFEGIGRLTQAVRRWFPAAFAPEAPPLPIGAEFQHGFSGLVMLADWLGSDTRFFPYNDDPTSDRMCFARERARFALSETFIDVEDDRVGLGNAPVDFAAVSAFPPREIQRHLLDLPTDNEGSLVLLESETGSGKTEAALARFLRLFQAGQVDGLYFALPTRTAATQIHRRVVEAVTRAFPLGRRPPVVLAVPGYIAVDEVTGYRLPNFDVLWNDNPAERFRYRGWAAEHPKRYLAGTVVVGTIDQVLLSVLMVGHAHMRSTALLRHLLVVDEVHASDTYMVTVLHAVLANHLAAGGHALLMSATLGSAARSRLLSAWSGNGSMPVNLEVEAEQPYPLITHLAEGIRTIQPVQSDYARKRVGRDLRPWMSDPEAISRAALDAASRGARVIVLRNTVGDCVTTQRALEKLADASGQTALLFRCEGIPAPHHARFGKGDRELLDQAIEASFGKQSPAVGQVAVTTQTVQQSLDLDADLLLTDLCPMDVFLQRIGRLHRHERVRPAGFEEPKVIVLTPEERDLSLRIDTKGASRGGQGIGTVYDDLRTIEATWRLLLKHLVLDVPDMNRMLVEGTTHPTALRAIVEELGGRWAAHAIWLAGATTAHRQIAALNLIDRVALFGEQGTEFPGDGLERRIQTRLGEPDRFAELVSTKLGEGDRIAAFDGPIGPFAKAVTKLTIPAYLARFIPSEAAVSDLTCFPGGFEFTFAPRRFVYDRLGLRLSSDVKDDQEDLADA